MMHFFLLPKAFLYLKLGSAAVLWACSCRNTEFCCYYSCSESSHFSNWKVLGAFLCFFQKSWQHKVQIGFSEQLQRVRQGGRITKQILTLKNQPNQLKDTAPQDCYWSCLDAAVSSGNDLSDKQVDTFLSHSHFPLAKLLPYEVSTG